MRTSRASRRFAPGAERLLRAALAVPVSLAIGACGQALAPSGTLSPTQALSTAAPSPGLGAFPPLPPADLPADVVARLEAILDETADQLDAPGIAAAVIAADRGTWVGAAGTADGKVRLDPAAQFAVGSVTKTVVAAQVLQLVESGAVDLDRPIADYLDGDVPTNGATMRQVLGMRSGIKDLKGDVRAICADGGSGHRGWPNEHKARRCAPRTARRGRPDPGRTDCARLATQAATRS